MKKDYLPILFLCMSFCFISVVDVFGLTYAVSPYAQYTSTTSSGRMTTDDAGNVYVAHYDDGKIVKINQEGQSSVLVSNLGPFYDITWGGGTAYGNYLYATSPYINTPVGHKLYKINANTGSATSIPMEDPSNGPCAIGIDRQGNYNNLLYIGTGSVDRVSYVTPTGAVSTFSLWPGKLDGGGVYGLSFDPTGKYNNKMYLATIFGNQNANVSGLFAMNPDGTVSRFAADLVAALNVDFDPVGTYFDNDMFVLGKTSFFDAMSLWRVAADGSCQEFMTNVSAFAFGGDGAMYVSNYNWTTHEVTISRVVPEPATLLLLAADGLVLCKRKA